MHHVIIGAGPAGVVAADNLRKLDPAAKITIVGDEPEAPYSRMAIPYYLSDDIEEAGTHLRKTDGYFVDKSIVVVQDRVQSIAAQGQKISLEKGGEMAFDRLLIATGSRAVSPPISGLDLPGVHNCWTLQDARHIVSLARPDSKVVLMGAGFIGCIILEALAARGVDLTVVEMEDRMVPRMMDQASGGLIKSWCEGKGVTVLTSTRVSGVAAGSDHALTIALENGGQLPADLLISATGVVPNVGLLDGSGIETDQGIVVDQRLQTTAHRWLLGAGDSTDRRRTRPDRGGQHGRGRPGSACGLHQYECARHHGADLGILRIVGGGRRRGFIRAERFWPLPLPESAISGRHIGRG